MSAVGIVAEYNPFHNGHLFQIKRIRAIRGADTPIVAVLSGDFVQRGEAAVFSKFARAEAAVRCGVSLVIELPLPWSLASAEGFARGGIGLLRATGVVDAVAFGSESENRAAMERCVETLGRDEYVRQLREALREGISFAAAREKAVSALAGEETAGILRSPNDLLGVEYIRAAKALEFYPEFLLIPRDGAAHDGPGSASFIRRRMGDGESVNEHIPDDAYTVFHRENEQGRGPVLPSALRLPLLSRLRERRAAEFANLPDAGEGLEYKLYKAAREETDPESIALRAKSKRYALSRLRRMVMCAALGVEKGMADGVPPYIRVLAMDGRGAELLHAMRKSAALPVVTKPAHVNTLDENIRAIFELGSRAHDLYVLGYSDPAEQRGGNDYRTSPFYLR